MSDTMVTERVFYVLSYTDPCHTVEGPRKTRHFDDREKAVEWMGRFMPPEATSVTLTRMHTRTSREIVYSA